MAIRSSLARRFYGIARLVGRVRVVLYRFLHRMRGLLFRSCGFKGLPSDLASGFVAVSSPRFSSYIRAIFTLTDNAI